jgi:hypothetical protein
VQGTAGASIFNNAGNGTATSGVATAAPGGNKNIGLGFALSGNATGTGANSFFGQGSTINARSGDVFSNWNAIGGLASGTGGNSSRGSAGSGNAFGANAFVGQLDITNSLNQFDLNSILNAQKAPAQAPAKR